MTHMPTISCYIIGETSLAQQCAQTLIEQRCSLLGICTSDKKLKSWCSDNKIQHFETLNALKESASKQPFDYLFSIVNGKILHTDVLKLPAKFAINYHDAPLPKYAGVHTTSWAILNDEPTHGITWHIVNAGIDTGDILKQSHFVIEPDETALSLNLKCYAAAINCFRELIRELAENTQIRLQQDLGERSCFTLHQKPPRNGLISWHDSAENIYRYHRALTFGNYDNDFSSLKCIIGDDVFIVCKLRMLGTAAGLLPGWIVNISKHDIQISTETYDVSISELTDLQGKAIDFQSLPDKYKLHYKTPLPNISDNSALSFQKKSEKIAKFEKFWITKLGHVANFVTLPFFNYCNASKKQKIFDLALSFLVPKYSTQIFLFTAVLIYLARINNTWNFTVVINNHSAEKSSNIRSLFTDWLPINLELKANGTFHDAYENILQLLNDVYKNEYFLCDIAARYPNSSFITELQNTIKFDLVDDIDDAKISHNAGITIIVPKQDERLRMVVNLPHATEEQQNFIQYIDQTSIHLKALLSAAQNNSACLIKQLPILSAHEIDQQLSLFNGSRTEYPHNNCLYDIFIKQVNLTPNQPAVIYYDISITYRELSKKASHLASLLTNFGIKPGDGVAIYMSRSLEAVISILGIIKAGAVYVPLDPALPKNRIQYIASDSTCKLCLTTENLYSKCSSLLSTVKIHAITDSEYSEEVIDCRQHQKPLDAAYIMYTSGTTGVPKGVKIPHRGIIRLVKNTNYVDFGCCKKMAHAASIAFDASTLEIWGALLNGLTIVIIPQSSLLDLAEFASLLNKNPVDIAWLTSSLFNEIVTTNCSALSNIKYLLIGGEKLNPAKIHQFYLENNTTILINGYGPTENTTFTTSFVIPRNWPKHKNVPIGKPIANTTVYVLDSNLQPLPVGSTGELFAGGDGLAIDYQNDTVLTKEKFISCVLKDKYVRLYRTGDLARWLPDGTLEYFGRIDKQVKIRGFRVELSAIEYLIEKYNEVKQCAVFLKTANNTKHLVAYVVVKDKGKFNKSDLSSLLKEELPEYAVPAAIMILDEIPLTSNNKINEQALPDPIFACAIDDAPPTTSAEHTLLAIFQEVLDLKNLSISSNFFSLGGDSIIAMHVVAKARSLGLYFTPAQLFNHPTIKELASIVSLSQQDKLEKSYELTDNNILLTPIQKWFFTQKHQSINYFNQVLVLKLTRKIAFYTIQQAFDYLYQYHGTLRIYFRYNNNKWQQYYSKDKPSSDFIEKVPIADNGNIEQILNNKIASKSTEITINNSPLMRILCIEGENQAYLAIIAHHLIVDGVSWRILLDDFTVCCQLIENGKKIALPYKTTSFADWSKKLTEYSSSKGLLLEKDYWLQINRRDFILPKDKSVNKHTQKTVDRVFYNSLTEERTKKAAKTAQTIYVQMNELLLAAIAACVYSWSGQKCLYLNLEGHGREAISEDVDLSRTIGWFTSIFPFFLDFSPVKSDVEINNILPLVKEQLRAVPNKGIGYGILRYLSIQNQIADQLMQQDEAEISFNYLGNIDVNFSKEWFSLVDEPIKLCSSNDSIYALDITAWISKGCMRFKWSYSSNLYDDITVKNLATACVENIILLLAKHEHKEYIAPPAPSDFPLIDIEQSQIDNLIKEHSDIETILPLSSTQSGILFHSLRNPDSEVYLTQVYWRHNSRLDPSLMNQAWSMLLEKHDALRAKFVWLGLAEPLQLISRHVDFSVDLLDWSTKHNGQKDLEDFLYADRLKTFNLSSTPLLRFTIIKIDDCKYTIIWSHHHILLDGWSVGVILNELYLIYAQLLANNVLEKQASVVAYGDYLHWVKNKPNNHDKVFWQRYLTQATFGVYLNFSQSQYNYIENIRYASAQSAISIGHSTMVRHFARQHGFTLNTIFQTAFSLILTKYSNNKDIVFGVTVASRPEVIANIQKLVGLCINTLPFRIIFDEANNSLLTYLQKTQSNMALINEHSTTSLLDIKDWVKSANELFHVVFIFENYGIKVPDKHASNIKINDYTNYPLVLYVFPRKKITLKIVYDSRLFSHKFIQSFLQHITNVVNTIIENPHAKACNIEIFTAAEKKKILNFSYGPNKPYPQKTIAELFSAVALKYSGKIAVRFKDKSINYSQLDVLSNKLANYFLTQGIKPGSLVITILERGIPMVVGLLAILKIGAAYVPVSHHYPLERVKLISQDTEAKFVIASSNITSAFLEYFHDSDISVLELDDPLTIAQNHSDKLPAIPTHNTDLMYVIYTSGSTGVPKGVMIEHRSVVNILYDIFDRLHITSEDIFFSVTNITFDISVLEIFGSIVFGLQLVIADREEIVDGQKLKQQILNSKATVIQATPSMWQILTATKLSPLRKLKILVGGEKLSRKLADELLLLTNNVWNVYGPTETTIWSMIEKISVRKQRIDIGKPIANTTVHILDDTGDLTPLGAIGELYIGGDGVARGYLNREDLDKLKFVGSNVSDRYSKIYRTGDLVKMWPTGSVEFIDRVDDQIKFNGHRIELGEISSTLLKYRGIQECIVTSNLYNNEQLLTAYYVKNSDINIESIDLRNFLHNHLPAYMVPSLFICVKSLPLTASSKIDKKYLEKIFHDFFKLSTTQEKDEPSLTDDECKLAAIWQEILHTPVNHKKDDFFFLGGNSLSTLKLITKVKEVFQIDLEIHDIILASNLADLLALIQSKEHNNSPNTNTSLAHVFPIIQLTKTGVKQPIFFIHPVGGSIFWFASLAKYLNIDHPVYGIYDPGIEKKQLLFSSLEEMSTFYLQCIKKIQKNGPYLIGGASFGATAAIEIAHQLEAANEEIALVSLFDGWAIYPEKIQSREFLNKNMWRQYRDIKDKLMGINCKLTKPLIDINLHRNQLLNKYMQPNISSSVLLLKAKEIMPVFSNINSYCNYWDKTIENLSIIEVSGNHESMFYPPNVQKLATVYSEFLLKNI